jgi:hypothetical protein
MLTIKVKIPSRVPVLEGKSASPIGSESFWRGVLLQLGKNLKLEGSSGGEVFRLTPINCLSDSHSQENYNLSIDGIPSIFLHNLLLLLKDRIDNFERKIDEYPLIDEEFYAEYLQRQILNVERNWWAKNFYLHFSVLDLLSETKYEQSTMQNVSIVLALENSLNLNPPEFIQFSKLEYEEETCKLCVKNIKHIRKLLAGAGTYALAFGRSGVNYDCLGYVLLNEKNSSLFPIKIDIIGFSNWKLSYAGKEQFSCKMHTIQAVHKSHKEEIKGVVSALQKELGIKDPAWIEKAVDALTEQTHGTAALFFDSSIECNKVLCERFERLFKNKRAVSTCYQIDSPDLSFLTHISGIDGALVIDPIAEKLLYFSMIVDGNSVLPGDPARGARHNGLKTFIDSLANDTYEQDTVPRAMAAVFSEDGGVQTYSVSQSLSVIKKIKSSNSISL